MNHTNTEEGTSDTGSPVLVMLVAQAEWLDFLPRHFGRQMMTFETAVYAQMRFLAAEYSGATGRSTTSAMVAASWPRAARPCGSWHRTASMRRRTPSRRGSSRPSTL
jgi:hypothetical protein